jgi:hypothetical protein
VGTSGDTDTDQSAITMLVPPTTQSAWSKMTSFVARGTGFKGLYLVYTHSGGVLQLVHDTDGDGAPDAGDELLTTLTLSNW